MVICNYNLTRLKASISCLQAELEVELTAREEAEVFFTFTFFFL